MRFSFKKLVLFPGLSLIVFVGWFVWQLFGPVPSIVISKETTYITAPLRADGLPDYEKYVLEKYREGVTPENNAAVLFWQAMGPGGMEPSDFAAVTEEIDLETLPPPNEFLNDIYSDETSELVSGWLETERILPHQADGAALQEAVAAPDNSREDVIMDLLDQAGECAWTSDQIPPLAEWVATNQKPFDLLIAASQRTRFYSASPELLNDTGESLVLMTLPGLESTRKSARSLSVRAMWLLGEGRIQEAWNDILAIYRFSRLTGQGETIVELIVAMAIEGIANRATLTLLDSPNISPELAKQIIDDLETLSARNSINDSLNQFERIGALSYLLSVRDGTADELELSNGLDAIKMATAFDWNIPLRVLNRSHDELAAAARLPKWSARQIAIDKFEARLNQASQSITPGSILGAAVSRSVRSGLLADIFVALMLPATSAACAHEDRANTQLALTQLAAALAIYRVEHGEYPESLESLLPEVLNKLPVDLFHDNPFAYRRTQNGYLLYSHGPNGKDDAGSSQQMNNFKGYSTDLETSAQLPELLSDDLPMVDDETALPNPADPVMRPFGADDTLDAFISQDADDIAIRLPLPKLELPKRLEPTD